MNKEKKTSGKTDFDAANGVVVKEFKDLIYKTRNSEELFATEEEALSKFNTLCDTAKSLFKEEDGFQICQDAPNILSVVDTHTKSVVYKVSYYSFTDALRDRVLSWVKHQVRNALMTKTSPQVVYCELIKDGTISKYELSRLLEDADDHFKEEVQVLLRTEPDTIVSMIVSSVKELLPWIRLYFEVFFVSDKPFGTVSIVLRDMERCGRKDAQYREASRVYIDDEGNMTNHLFDKCDASDSDDELPF